MRGAPSSFLAIALSLSVAVLLAAAPGRAVDSATGAAQEANTAQAADTERPTFFGVDVDALVDEIVSLRFLDPAGPEWAPRSGERLELAVLLGGEAAGAGLSPDKLPTLGGVVLTGLGRYYPVDRMAVMFGTRTYLGVDRTPAAGTRTSQVVTAMAGARYDLVRENRFSLLWDLYSGPSLYVFADTSDLLGPGAVAVGGEMGTGLALRYSIGPFNGEARGIVGARAGASNSPFRRAFAAGPFSAVYAGVDVGASWSP